MWKANVSRRADPMIEIVWTLWSGFAAGLTVGVVVGYGIGRVWTKLQDIRYEREIERLGKAKA